MDTDGYRVLRRTRSICPECLEDVDAEVAVNAEGGWLLKHCPEHGTVEVRLSKHPDYFEQLDTFYFRVMPESLPQRDFIIRLTERCNLDCRICLASANKIRSDDFTLEDLRKLAVSRKHAKWDLMGAEPTVREDLPEIVRMFREAGHLVSLHTNGIKLADLEYARTLREAGLEEVHLQFDGFDDDYYRAIRSRPLIECKLKVLENLEKLDISADLKATIVKGYNEGEVKKVLDLGVSRRFVKEVFFLGCRSLGAAKDFIHTECLLPDDMIDLVSEQTEGRISRKGVRQFQKLYFTFLSLFSVRKCLYIQHYIIIRNKDGTYTPIDQVVNLDRIEAKLDKFAARGGKPSWFRKLRLLFSLGLSFLTPRGLGLVKDFIALKLLLQFGVELAKVPKRAILLGFVTACDPYIFDEQIAMNCGKGEISYDQGSQDSGAVANILREKSFREGN